MNERFKNFSLLAGGAHYPTINPDMQQKFGELVVLHILERMEQEIAHSYEVEDNITASTLQALALTILDDFDMEVPGDDWDAEEELQKIFDEFDLPGDAK